MTIGAGRRLYQMLQKINRSIESREFFKNETLLSSLKYALENKKKVHLIGITSDGGIHSHIDHLFALMGLCKQENISPIIHFVSDGRDTPPLSAKEYVKKVLDKIDDIGVGRLATIIGRYYAFDRDKNYDRNKVAYELWVNSKGKKYDDAFKAIDEAYKSGESDEFLTPIVLSDEGQIEDGDVAISYNFRTDRERQTAFVLSQKNDLDFTKNLNLYFVTMTRYDDSLDNIHVVFENDSPQKILSEVLSNSGIKQLKVAETEKFAHLTFFFNSGRIEPYPLEERILIDSKKLPSYASVPQMSAKKIVEAVLENIDKYDFIAVNFANSDMVGHSGDINATKKAVEVVDECVMKLVEAILLRGGQGIITSDHGNADKMQYENGEKCTSHTLAKVPCIVFGKNYKGRKLIDNLDLSSIAPTILGMMNIQVPKEMTGELLLS